MNQAFSLHSSEFSISSILSGTDQRILASEIIFYDYSVFSAESFLNHKAPPKKKICKWCQSEASDLF